MRRSPENGEAEIPSLFLKEDDGRVSQSGRKAVIEQSKDKNRMYSFWQAQ